MTIETLPQDPTSYDLIEQWVDRTFVAGNGSVQTEGRTGNHWILSAVFAGRTPDQLRELRGFLALVRGQRNRVKFLIPGYTIAGGMSAHLANTVQLVGAHTAGATSISIDGLQASLTPAFKAGDYLTINNQLVEVSADANSDGGGAATVSIWPELHQAYADNTSVEYVAPFGVFLQQAPASRNRPEDLTMARIQITLMQDVLA